MFQPIDILPDAAIWSLLFFTMRKIPTGKDVFRNSTNYTGGRVAQPISQRAQTLWAAFFATIILAALIYGQVVAQ
jgi:hypothetical protein